jgi:CheY-like chemotaxis protein
METVNIVLVDDNKDIRDMILNIFDDWLELNNFTNIIEFDIVEFDNGIHLIEHLEEKEARGWYPDFCLIDYFMDYGNGHYVVTKLGELYPDNNLNIAVITAWADERDLTAMQQNKCMVLDKTDLNEVEQFIHAQLYDVVNHFSLKGVV